MWRERNRNSPWSTILDSPLFVGADWKQNKVNVPVYVHEREREGDMYESHRWSKRDGGFPGNFSRLRFNRPENGFAHCYPAGTLTVNLLRQFESWKLSNSNILRPVFLNSRPRAQTQPPPLKISYVWRHPCDVWLHCSGVGLNAKFKSSES